MNACGQNDSGWLSVGTATDDSDDPDPSRSPNHTPNIDIDTDIDLLDATERLSRKASAWLRDRLGDALTHLATTGEVRIRIVDDAEMADAHEHYSGVPGTTDVLTFDLADGAAKHNAAALDVDLLLCLDEAHRRASDHGHGQPQRELLLYALHGVLHCLGEDDQTPEGFAAMHAREDAVLCAIGVGAIFNATHQQTTHTHGTHPDDTHSEDHR